RRHAADSMKALWHLGSTAAMKSLGGNVYDVGGLKITLLGSVVAAPAFTAENDGGSTRIGTLMTETLAAGPITELDMVRVFSETEGLPAKTFTQIFPFSL